MLILTPAMAGVAGVLPPALERYKEREKLLIISSRPLRVNIVIGYVIYGLHCTVSITAFHLCDLPATVWQRYYAL